MAFIFLQVCSGVQEIEKLMGNEETDGIVLYSSKFGYVIKYDRRIMRNITPH